MDSVQRVFTRVARPLSPADASASAAVRDGAAWFPFTCPRLVERKQVSVFSVSATAGVSNSSVQKTESQGNEDQHKTTATIIIIK